MTSRIEELEWSEHALDELPFGMKPGDVEKALREKRLRRRGREKGEYEIICVSHGRFLFLVAIKKEYGFTVKTIRYATDREKDLYRRAFG